MPKNKEKAQRTEQTLDVQVSNSKFSKIESMLQITALRQMIKLWSNIDIIVWVFSGNNQC